MSANGPRQIKVSHQGRPRRVEISHGKGPLPTPRGAQEKDRWLTLLPIISHAICFILGLAAAWWWMVRDLEPLL